jgi:type VI secretion system protein ImpF
MPREEDRPVQQSVLDRLIDEDPGKVHEMPPTRAQSIRALKAVVRRDLEWLLNTRAIAVPPPEEFKELKDSVYTYGLPDLSSLSADDPESRTRLMEYIARALEVFEPRLTNVYIGEAEVADERSRQVRFVIEAALKMDPSPEFVVFDTLLDLASRQYAVKADGSA